MIAGAAIDLQLALIDRYSYAMIKKHNLSHNNMIGSEGERRGSIHGTQVSAPGFIGAFVETLPVPSSFIPGGGA